VSVAGAVISRTRFVACPGARRSATRFVVRPVRRSHKTRYRTGGHVNSADRAGIESGLGDARAGRAPRALGDCWWCARNRRSARARNSNGSQAAESDDSWWLRVAEAMLLLVAPRSRNE